MKRAKRFLSLLLTLCMFLGMLPGTVFAADSSLPFTDVKESDWYYEAAQYVYDNGMMSGTGANTFSPNTTTTRGMIVTILHRMEGTPAVAGEKFTDVPAGQYYSNAVAWASANSIVCGYGNGTFGPDDPITREQMAAILYRYAQYKGYDVSQSADLGAFTDADAISQYAKNAMAWANAEGLMNGVTRTTLGPKGNATRAQVAAMLMRFCENVASTNQIPSYSPTPDPTPTPTPDVFYTVTFESNGGSKIASQDIRKGEKVAKPDDPAKDGYMFTGWYVDEELTKAYDFETPVTSDMTLYAGWEEVAVWRVTVNGKSVTLTTMPQVVDGEVFVPMIPVLTAMNFEVVWNESNDTLIAMRNGFLTRLIAGEMSGLVNGEKAEKLENTVEVMKRNPYGSAALLQEVFGAVLTADTESLTAEVTGSVPAYLNWFDANNFSELGTWSRTGSYVQGLSGGSTLEDALAQGHETQPAVMYFTVPEDGAYHLWIEGRDFTTNQPGDRYFNVTIDGEQSAFTFGNHTVDPEDNSGVDGFFWENGGVFNLTAGTHKLELLDTSTFFARCNGVVIAAEPYGDGTYNPNQDLQDGKSVSGAVVKYDTTATVITTVFPTWAKAEMTTTDETVSIENGTTKVVFYQGSDTKGHSWVQNEIYIDVDGVWTLVKERTEELGWLMQRAISSEYLSVDDSCATIMGQAIDNGGSTSRVTTVNYFAAGKSTWFIPESITKISDKEVRLTFQTDENAVLTVTYSFDDLAEEPKVTLDVKFKNDGAYSFLLFSGDGVDYEDFERVTAPLLYIKKDMPDEIGAVISDSWMFTPMSTFTYPEGTVTAGQKFTSGVVMDPGCIDVEDQYTYPDTARFGTTFKTIDGQYRNQLVAPMFGTDNCVFKSGDVYSVAYRLVNRNEDWFDTYKHITQDLYNLQDVRENYYTSINEAIYNTVDMIMDDVYSGWDENAMGFYNMEGSMLVSHSNPLIMVQQYLLAEDEEFLTDRTIPTLAYILSRGSAHFAYATSIGGATPSYAGTNGPSTLKTTPTSYGTNVYNALYEMTQGRVPFFMDYALNKVNSGNDSAGLLSTATMYQIAKESGNDELAALIVRSIVNQADSYMETAAPFQMDTSIVNVFVNNDYVDPVAAFLAAYEVTGDVKYLNAAEESAQLLTTSVWTTGYQNDNVSSMTHLDADETLARDTNADASNANFFWYGDVKWRPGESWEDNYNAQNDNDKSPLELAQLYREQVTEALTDDVPSWLLAKAGMGTEHVRTPGHGNVITMSSYAGTLEKLTQLTGEDYFETMSRSAILGRFSTYAGYYNDRNIVYQMKENWYEDGPDFTNIYWHHIPIFLSILEDYLINSVYVQSEGNITFPSTVYNGYAYFHTNHYGFDSGKFYDQDDMWLWLDEGIVSSIDDGSEATRNSSSGNEVNVDYIAARKDGVLGLAFVNEDDLDMSVTITLGDKVPGGGSYSGTAVVYDAAGNKSTVTVTNGTFTLDIPAKGIRSVVLNIAGVQAPAYAKTESYALSNAMGDTVLDNTDDDGNITGKSYVLQLTDEEYFAYVYTTRMATEDDETNGIGSLTIRYTIDGGKTYAEETDSLYPFEFIVKVADPNATFEYTLTGNKADGTTVNLGSGTLKTLTGSGTEAKLSIPDNIELTFTPLEESWKGGEVPATKLSSAYVGNASGNLRVVANISDFTKYVDGGIVTVNCLRGLKVYGIFTNKSTGAQTVLESWVTGNEMRTGQTVLIVPATAAVPSQTYDNYTYVIAFGDPDTTEEEFLAALNDTGPDMSDVVLTGQITNVGTLGTSAESPAYMRLVIDKRDDIDVVNTVGMKVVARLVGKDDTDVAGSTLWLDSTVKEGGTNQAGTAWVLSVDWTEDVPWQDKNYYSDNYIIHYVAVMPENELADTNEMKAYIEDNYPLSSDTDDVPARISGGSVVNSGSIDGLMRLVVNPVAELETPDVLVGRRLVARLVSKTDDSTILWLDTQIARAAVRSAPDPNWNLDVNWTVEVPAVGGNYYANNYNIAYVIVSADDSTITLESLKDYLNATYPLAADPEELLNPVSGTVINNGTIGAADNSGQMRLVVKPVDGMDVTALVGQKLVARLVSKSDASEILWMDTKVVNTAVRSDSNWNVEVNWTTDVPYQAGNYYAINYNIVYAIDDVTVSLESLKAFLNGTYPITADSSLVLFNSVVTNGTVGDANGQMRLVVKPVDGVDVTALVGNKLVARLVSKADASEILWMDTKVVNTAVRSDSNWNVEVSWTDDVPYQAGNYYANNYNIVFVTVDSDDEMTDFETLKYYIQAHA